MREITTEEEKGIRKILNHRFKTEFNTLTMKDAMHFWKHTFGYSVSIAKWKIVLKELK